MPILKTSLVFADTRLLRELARVKAIFQQRAIVAHVTEGKV